MIPAFFTRFEKQADIANVVDGGLCTALLRTKKNVHGILFRCTTAGTLVTLANLALYITNLKLKIRSDTKIECSVKNLQKIISYYYRRQALSAGNGYTDGAGVLYLPFTRPNIPDAAQRNAFSWGMADIESIGLEMQMAADITMDKIEVWLEVDDAPPRPLGAHICIRPMQFSTADPLEITTLPLGDASIGIGRLALHLDLDAVTTDAVIASVTDKIDGINIYDAIPPEVNEHMLRAAGRYQQTLMYHVDYSRANSLAGFMPMDGVRSNKLTVDFTTQPDPAQLPIYIEQIEGLLLNNK